MKFLEKVEAHYEATAAVRMLVWVLVHRGNGKCLAVFTTKAKGMNYLSGMKRNEEWTLETFECDPKPSED